MSTATYALSCLLFVLLVAALSLALRVLIDALALFHAAGMARVHNHTRRTSP